MESDLGHRSPGEDLDDMGPVTPFTLNNPQQSASNQDNSTRSPASMTNDSTHTPLNSSNQQSLQSGPSDKGPKYHRDGGPVVQNDGIGTETDDTDVPQLMKMRQELIAHFVISSILVENSRIKIFH